MASGPLHARVVEEALSNGLPQRVGPVQADRVDLLDFDDSAAALASDSQQVARNLVQPLRSGGRPMARLGSIGAGVL